MYTFATGSKRKNSNLNVNQISIALKMFGQCHRQLGVPVSGTSVRFPPVYIFYLMHQSNRVHVCGCSILSYPGTSTHWLIADPSLACKQEKNVAFFNHFRSSPSACFGEK